VAHKNLTKKSNLQGRSHQPYFKDLLEGIPQTFYNYRMINKVNKMWSMAQKIVRKTQKLLQQQNKKIQDLEIKLVKFYNREEMAKDCETKFIEKFRNMLMRHGKKSKAYATLFQSLKLFRRYLGGMSVQEEFIQKLAETKSNNYILHCLQEAVENVKPSLEVRKKKISGIIRQIPAVPSKNRQDSVSIRWIIESARKRKKKSSKPFFQCLAEEFLDAYKNQGEPYKRKQALHKAAEANRIYIRHRWW
jgi:small subunit ribosomal protein S7